MLKGSFRFYCDLTSSMGIDTICDFYSASSYGLKDKPSTEVRLNLDVQVDLQDKHVILVKILWIEELHLILCWII